MVTERAFSFERFCSPETCVCRVSIFSSRARRTRFAQVSSVRRDLRICPGAEEPR